MVKFVKTRLSADDLRTMRGGLVSAHPVKAPEILPPRRHGQWDGLRAGLEAACRVTTAAPVLEAVGSTRPARWFRRPVCGPEEQ